MNRTGIVELGLHSGFAPSWLIARMRKLAECIFSIMTDLYGPTDTMMRLADPLWFQALGATLGFDFDSSGVTSVTCAVLKSVIDSERHGFDVAGGKGRNSRSATNDIRSIADSFTLSTQNVDSLVYASRMTAKVDNAAIQAGYPIYHHCIFVSERGDWVVVQQGMNVGLRLARRYHWASPRTKSFVNQPGQEIVAPVRHERVLDMTARESEGARMASVELVRDLPALRRTCASQGRMIQSALTDWMGNARRETLPTQIRLLPEEMNWKALDRAYNFSPRNYEQLLATPGVGPSTVRGLALVAELVYGRRSSWRDPAKFAWAFGGKDGVPFPVDRHAMDGSILMLKQAVEEARVGRKEKMLALTRLRSFVPPDLQREPYFAARWDDATTLH